MREPDPKAILNKRMGLPEMTEMEEFMVIECMWAFARQFAFNWKNFDLSDKTTHPEKPGRYLIYREKCDKMHFEQWNGIGWASSNNDCTEYCIPNKPQRNDEIFKNKKK